MYERLHATPLRHKNEPATARAAAVIRVDDMRWLESAAVMTVEKRGISIEIVETVITLPKRIPMSQKR